VGLDCIEAISSDLLHLLVKVGGAGEAAVEGDPNIIIAILIDDLVAVRARDIQRATEPTIRDSSNHQMILPMREHKGGHRTRS
jgi:hypothetical protein